MKRGVLVTAAGPNMTATLRDVALPSFESYADRWGYDVEATALASDGIGADASAQRAKWAKVALLRKALTTHDYAVWFDADVLLVRTDEDIVSHLQRDDFQGLALEQVPYERRVNPNTGVWVLRSCAQAFAFLDAVEDAGQQPGPWADQGAVLAALGWDRGDLDYRGARPGPGNAFCTSTSWLPPGWNQPFLDRTDATASYNSSVGSYDDRPAVRRPHAVHFMGMTPVARYTSMAAYAAAAQPPATSSRQAARARRSAITSTNSRTGASAKSR